MPSSKSPLTRETIAFLRDLARHNKKEWMDANRERYQSALVKPFRELCEQLSPEVLKLDSGFDTRGKSGANFSRINRDIRFAKDKTPYRTHMYLKFSVPFPGEGEAGQLYVGLSLDAATVGFRIYGGSKRRESTLGLLADARLQTNPRWLAQQKLRLGKRFDSYWYSTVKGEWTKNAGWPTPEQFPKLQGWIVRRKFPTSAVTKSSFPKDAAKIFREVFPLLKFTSLRD